MQLRVLLDVRSADAAVSSYRSIGAPSPKPLVPLVAELDIDDVGGVAPSRARS